MTDGRDGTGGLGLDRWIARRLKATHPLGRADLDATILDRLRAALDHARADSPFYRSRDGWPDARPGHLGDLAAYPFTFPAEIVAGVPPLVAVSQSEVAHVVSLPTSGTSGPAKRLFFSPEDIEATVDFFAAGMGVFTRAGDRVAIAFPAERTGGVGQSLAAAIGRLGAQPFVLPASASPAELVELLRREAIDVVAGPPVRLNAAARLSSVDGGPPLRPRALLVSSDILCPAVGDALRRLWGAEVFDHWGMTETGLGGAVECPCHDGLHVRELDLRLEIVDPLTGAVQPEGTPGEIVVTTLGRRAMPLVRYRTGDIGRLDRARCRCGSALVRLNGFAGRRGAGYELEGGGRLTLAMLDAALFALDDVADFSATVDTDGGHALLRLVIAVPSPVRADFDVAAVRAAVAPLAGGSVDVDVALAAGDACDHAGKRRLIVL